MGMEKIDLLFVNDENRERWQEVQSHYSQTVIDLNIEAICAYLVNINSDFPVAVLQKPCFNVHDAEYRLSIMNEVFTNMQLNALIVECSIKMKSLYTSINELQREKNPFQRQYRYLKIVSEYFICLDETSKAVENSYSEGLARMYEYCLNFAAQLSQIRTTAEILLGSVEEMLNDCLLTVETSTSTYSVEKLQSSVNDSEVLKSHIFDVFGIAINNIYSIVDPAPFGNVEGKVLSELQKLNPHIFGQLSQFYESTYCLAENIEAFSKLYTQLSFYTAFARLYQIVRNGGVCISRPKFNHEEFFATNCACPALAVKFLENGTVLNSIVTNNVSLAAGQMFLLSGPNQGGKTIYIKSVGMTAYLAKCGCLVLAEQCSVPFYDSIFTHFMQKEVLGKGRLVEEIERLGGILPHITENTLLLLNESFASTRRRDGVKIALYYLDKFNKMGCSVGFVSHYYEIPEMFGNSIIIPLSSGVEDDGTRTYKVTQTNDSNMAHAHDIVQKCGMMYEQMLIELGEKYETY